MLLVTVDLLRVSAKRNAVAVLHYEPRRARSVTLVAGHGYSSSKQNLDFLCSFLASHGFGVYNLDFPGHKLGASGGILRGVDDCLDAMQAVVAFARVQSNAPIYTIGHSMGAMTALFTAADDPQVAGAIAIATGYGRPSAISALRRAGATDFRASYVDGVTLPELVDGIDERYAQTLSRLAGRPALYIGANHDAMVSPSSVRELYERAPEPKALRTVDSDHTNAAENARSEVLQWLNDRHPRT